MVTTSFKKPSVVSVITSLCLRHIRDALVWGLKISRFQSCHMIIICHVPQAVKQLLTLMLTPVVVIHCANTLAAVTDSDISIPTFIRELERCNSHLAFVTLPLPILSVAFLELTASSMPSAPPSSSPKCLRFGTLNIHLLTYLLTSAIAASKSCYMA